MRFLRFALALGVIGVVAQADEAPSGTAYRSLGSLPNGTFAGALGSADERNPWAAQLLLEGTSTDKTGAASLEWKSGQMNWRFRLTGPLDEGTNEAVPLTLDGLGRGSVAELSFSRLGWRGSSPRERQDLQKLCDEARFPQACNPDDFPNPSDRRRGRRLMHLDDTLWYLGGSVSASRNAFTYSEKPDSAGLKATHNDWSAAARAGLFSGTFGFLIASYSYANKFEANPAQQICRPIDTGSPILSCKQVVVGAPEETKASVLTLELRRVFDSGIAVNPFVQRDLEEKVTSVVLPIYFLKGEKGLTGGVRAGWRSDTKDVSLSVFVGTAFTLQPK